MTSQRSATAELRFVTLLALLTALPLALVATTPSWWSRRRVLAEVGSPAAAINDYAPCNLGQVKNIAVAAFDELQETPEGAGTALHMLMSSWFELNQDGSFRRNPNGDRIPLAVDNDYAVINVGQLKSIAKPFYIRLDEIGYDTRQNLLDHGYPVTWDSLFPWNDPAANEANYSPANIGQLKLVFSFDLTEDRDQDGMPDWWEKKYFNSLNALVDADVDGDGMNNLDEFRNVTNPIDFFNEHPRSIRIVSGNFQVVSPGIPAADPLRVEVLKYDGQPFVNAPVHFSVVSGAGTLGTTGGGSSQLWARTDSEGRASAVFTHGPAAAVAEIRATTGNLPDDPQVLFTIATSRGADVVITPPGGSFATYQEVWLTTAEPDAIIYYTVDGSEPTDASDPVTPGEPIYIEESCLLKARVINQSQIPGLVRSATFRITGDVAAGGGHHIVLKTDRTVSAFGFNGAGNLGNGTLIPSDVPVDVKVNDFSLLREIVAIAAGQEHTIALKSDGTVWAWGFNADGQLGDGTNDARSFAVRVPGLSNIVAIAAGWFHSLALQADGTIWAWGYNSDDGILGDGSALSSNMPRRVVGFPRTAGQPVQLAAGSYHSFALCADGAVFAWGANQNGQLGNGTFRSELTPVQVNSLRDSAKLAGGDAFSFSVARDGTLNAWGYNGDGNLGLGVVGDDVASPTPVSSLSPVRAVRAGFSHAVTLTSGGDVRAFGANDHRQVSDGDTSPIVMPIQVSLPRPAEAVSAGYNQTMAITDDGGVWVWGEASGFDESGAPATSTRPIPTRIAAFSAQRVRDRDGDGIPDWREAELGTAFDRADTDRDGLPDQYEIQHQLDPIKYDAGADDDQDGLTNAEEFRFQTNPHNPDTDGDGANDAADGWPHHPQLKPARLPTARYAVILLPEGLRGAALNNKLEVAGTQKIDGHDEAVMWRFDGVTRLGTLPDASGETYPGFSAANALNDSGVVAGSASYGWNRAVSGTFDPHPAAAELLKDGSPHSYHGFRWDGAMHELADASQDDGRYLPSNGLPSYATPDATGKGASIASAINSAGLTVGNSAREIDVQNYGSHWGIIDFGTTHAVRFQGDNAVLIAPEESSSAAAGLNDSGAIVGSLDVNTVRPRAVIWHAGQKTVLHDPRTAPTPQSDSGSDAYAVNNQSIAVGRMQGSAVLWTAGYWISLQPNTEFPTIAKSINDKVQIVGSAFNLGPKGAYLWQNGQAHDLNTLIQPTNDYRIIGATAINRDGVILAETNGPNPSDPNNKRRSALLVPIGLMVDANRDGRMSFLDGLTRDRDQTESNQPYRFWLNDDQDVETRSLIWSDPDPETLPVLVHDYADTVIKSTRDLEDFARLWLSAPLESALLKTRAITVGLKWRNIKPGTTPRIRLFPAVEADGDWKYIRSQAIAEQQVRDGGKALRDALGRTIVEPTNGLSDFTFSTDQWEAAPTVDAPLHFIFEGVTEGEGDLEVVILEQGKAIAEIPGVRLNLMNIKRMYARAHTTPEPRHFPMPYQQQQATPRFPYVKTASGGLTIPPQYIGFKDGNGAEASSTYPLEPPADEIPACVVFVHGIDMDLPTYHSYAESGFKRFWWEGYRGRYCAFRWGTPLSPGGLTRLNDGIDIFNDGEMRAWSYGPGLTMYVNRLRAEMRTSRVSIMAHSLGNAVAGSALRGGLLVDSYVAMEAAVSLSCYFAPRSSEGNDVLASSEVPGLIDADASDPTPNEYSALGYRGFLRDLPNSIQGKLTAYQNIDDFWLATGTTRARLKKVDWISNQKAFRPNNLHGLDILKTYRFYPDRPVGLQCFLSAAGTNNDRIVDDSYEAMAFIARSRTRALGAEPATLNPQPINWTSVLDMQAVFGFATARYDHSGQFQRNIQAMYESAARIEFSTPFYRQLLQDLNIIQDETPP